MTFKAFLTRSRPLALCFFLTFSASAQQKRVVVDPPDLISLKRGTSLTQVTQVNIEPGSHVNSDKPRGQFLIPFRLEWEPGPLAIAAIEYPESHELQVGPDKLLVFTGSFGVKTQFEAPRIAHPGTFTVKGKLHFQACNTQMCFRPATLDIELPVTIE